MESFKVTAILASRDERDIVVRTVEHLLEEGVAVYFIDHESTDGSIEAIEPLVGHGVLAIESFPSESPFSPRRVEEAPWESLLRRKEQLAGEIDSDWFIHQDADEFRESPWEGLRLAEAVRRVDESGFNAIDFEVLEFPPVGREWTGEEDLIEAFPGWRSPRDERPQVRCWKKAQEVDLVSSGGQEVDFAQRRIFPTRFPMRHYPFRSQRHAERKVAARRALLESESARGWHRQYDELDEDAVFEASIDSLTPYDLAGIRSRLEEEATAAEERETGASEGGLPEAAGDAGWEKEARSWRRRVMELERELGRAEKRRERLARELERRTRQHEVLSQQAAKLSVELDERRAALETLGEENRALTARLDRRRHDLDDLRGRYRDLEHQLADTRRLHAEDRRALEAATRAPAEERTPSTGIGRFLRGRRRE